MCDTFIRGTFGPFTTYLETFVRHRPIRSVQDSKESILQAVFELFWFEDGRCIPEMCVVMDPTKPPRSGRYGFIDAFIASRVAPFLSRSPVVELKNVNLHAIWRASREDNEEIPTIQDLEAIRDALREESEEELLNRSFVFRDQKNNTWRRNLISNVKTSAFEQVNAYSRVIASGKAAWTSSGIIDKRVQCINRPSYVAGYVILCIGDTRVLAYHAETYQSQFMFCKL
jgi:hypothetical protein